MKRSLRLNDPPLDTAALYRLMQQYRLSVKDLMRLTGYKKLHIEAWIQGAVTPPKFLRTVIENQDRYKDILPREFRRVVSAREVSRRKVYRRPIPEVR